MSSVTRELMHGRFFATPFQKVKKDYWRMPAPNHRAVTTSSAAVAKIFSCCTASAAVICVLPVVRKSPNLKIMYKANNSSSSSYFSLHGYHRWMGRNPDRCQWSRPQNFAASPLQINKTSHKGLHRRRARGGRANVSVPSHWWQKLATWLSSNQRNRKRM